MLRIGPMTIVTAIAVIFLVAGLAFVVYRQKQKIRYRGILERAKAAGMAIDEDGNINAGLTYAAMQAREGISGIRFNGAAGDFLQLVRLISEGPGSVDEIRFLIAQGFQPVVRPDGVVYVPCDENEHLSVPGEITLMPEDLAVLEDEESTG